MIQALGGVTLSALLKALGYASIGGLIGYDVLKTMGEVKRERTKMGREKVLQGTAIREERRRGESDRATKQAQILANMRELRRMEEEDAAEKYRMAMRRVADTGEMNRNAMVMQAVQAGQESGEQTANDIRNLMMMPMTMMLNKGP
jgi:hypothetical protein